MATLTREQLIKYIRSLEVKVKTYAVELKKRDQEINQLRSKLKSVSQESQNGDPAAEPKTQAEITRRQKAKALEERPKTFTKKAAVGADQKAKDAVREPKDVKPEPPTQSPEGFDETAPPSPAEISQEHPPEESEREASSQQQEAPDVFIPSIEFTPGHFLGAVIEGEEQADEVKAQLERLYNCAQDEKRNILLALTKLHWQMTHNMGKRLLHENLPWEKRLFMRYGMLDEKLMADRMDVWEQLYLDKSKPEDTGIYFIDEWLEAVAKGEQKFSTIDEMALDGRKPDQNACGAEALQYELINVPQMQRMAVGPRANTVTLLVQEYCSPTRDNPVINRAWLKETMDYCIKRDCKMFHRRHKGEDKEVQPIFIVAPGYGQKAGCWEPWSLGKKGTSGPRICLCAFPPRNSLKALLIGLADYRWEYAKADAMHYWLTEGLTGNWLALFSKKEQRKDLKEVFIESYILWVTKESHRIPKMEKRFREFFWHNVPFSDEVKQGLKGGGIFGRLIELEEAKKKREEEERQEIERIKAEREARRAARQAKLEGR